MVGLFTSRDRGKIWLALASGAGAALTPTVSHAATGDGATFAQTAMVTHWALPRAAQGVGALPEPTFVTPLDLTRPKDDRSASVKVMDPTQSERAKTRTVAVHAAAPVGPTLAQEELEASGYTQAQSSQRYRTPRDIKALEIAFQVLNAADAVTTLVCLKQDDCEENNPIYGKHPKPIVVVGAKALVGAIHYLAMESLLPDHPGMARALGWVTVTVQGGVVGLNLSQLF